MASVDDQNNEIDADSIIDVDPFGGAGKSIKVPHQNRINASQLAAEIGKKHGEDVSLIVVRAPSSGQRKVWIKPNDVDGRMASGIIKSHQADPTWGMTEAQVQNQENIKRLKSGEQLTLDEQNSLLRELLPDN